MKNIASLEGVLVKPTGSEILTVETPGRAATKEASFSADDEAELSEFTSEFPREYKHIFFSALEPGRERVTTGVDAPATVPALNSFHESREEMERTLPNFWSKWKAAESGLNAKADSREEDALLSLLPSAKTTKTVNSPEELSLSSGMTEALEKESARDCTLLMSIFSHALLNVQVGKGCFSSTTEPPRGREVENLRTEATAADEGSRKRRGARGAKTSRVDDNPRTNAFALDMPVKKVERSKIKR